MACFSVFFFAFKNAKQYRNYVMEYSVIFLTTFDMSELSITKHDMSRSTKKRLLKKYLIDVDMERI